MNKTNQFSTDFFFTFPSVLSFDHSRENQRSDQILNEKFRKIHLKQEFPFKSDFYEPSGLTNSANREIHPMG